MDWNATLIRTNYRPATVVLVAVSALGAVMAQAGASWR
jgi:hypothetical protein